MIDTFPTHFIFKSLYLYVPSPSSEFSMFITARIDTIGNTSAEHYTQKNILDVRSFARLNRSRRVRVRSHAIPVQAW